MIHKYGNEPMHNIVINDLDDNALEIIDYLGDNDIYLLRDISSGLFEGVLFDGDVIRYDSYGQPIVVSEMSSNELEGNLMPGTINSNAKRIKATKKVTD